MPKLTTTKYRNFSAFGNKIRLTNHRLIIFAISYACIPKLFPKQNINLYALAFIRSHILMSLFFCQVIH